ncbi:hypothetical protein J2S71_000886 [Olsenella profusa DSM 13989]|uniref:hypothetical protein n=1 Tax=Olsenella profusa TaxID=138595 RepID=UPI00277D9140|nr:hypothetical protein [Olsenella profusa]MDP9859190.1 hypothetical protein [Olsenella profusa DSM 13989]
MLWAVGVLLALSAVGFVWRIASRHDRGAESPDPGVLEWRMSRVWPAFVVACGLVFLGFAVWAGLASPESDRWTAWGFLGFTAFAFLAAAHIASWRVLVDGGGVHARRWLFGPRDVAWGDVDALSVVMAQRMMAGSVDSVAVMSGGRKAMRISGLVLGGPASQGRFLDEARRRGIPVAHPSELPAGLTPWGPLHRRYAALPGWKQNVVAIAITAASLGAFFLLLYVIGTAVGQIR